MTTRQNILSQVESILGGVSTLRKVLVEKTMGVDLEVQPLPIAFVYSGPEVRSTGAIGYETWEWKVMIEVWARDTEMETVLGLIHSAMHADERLGNYAKTSYRTSVEHFVLDAERSLRSMLIEYSVFYQHVKGTM